MLRLAELLPAAPLALLCCLAGGCATPARTWNFPELGFSVIETSPHDARKLCSGADRYDDGRPIPPGAGVEACFLPDARQIVVAWTRRDALLHELCHAARRPRASCAKVGF